MFGKSQSEYRQTYLKNKNKSDINENSINSPGLSSSNMGGGLLDSDEDLSFSRDNNNILPSPDLDMEIAKEYGENNTESSENKKFIDGIKTEVISVALFYFMYFNFLSYYKY